MACLFCTTCLQLQTLFQSWFQQEIRACKKKEELCGWSVVVIRVVAYMYHKTVYAFTPNILISDSCHWNRKAQIVYYSKEIIIIEFLMRVSMELCSWYFHYRIGAPTHLLWSGDHEMMSYSCYKTCLCWCLIQSKYTFCC